MTYERAPQFRTLRADPTLSCGQGAVDIEAVTDPTERQSIELQIREFGQTPKKVMSWRQIRCVNLRAAERSWL